jgi:phosphatidylglycerol:prolipoprotein diacylglycerol transferase
MVVVGFLCAWKALEVDIRRHKLLKVRANLIILSLAVAGLIGSKLYHVLETPADFAAHPLERLFFSQGLAWYGGLLGGVVALCLVAWHYKVPFLTIFDLAPAAALGYAFGRLGCLFAGDGDYGTPTSLPWGMSFPHGIVPTMDYVHPTPIYESIASIAIFLYLWRMAARPQPPGKILACYLLLTGAARFLIEFIRFNPRIFYGLTNAQVVSLLCVAAGGVLFVFPRRRKDNTLSAQRQMQDDSNPV